MEQVDLRSLPKRPAESSTPIEPKKSVQDNDLPMWRRLPCHNKYPLPSLPTKDIQLLVKPLGKSLYESFPNKDFDLSEKAVPPTLTYSSLNDPHLRNYFRSPSSQRHLVRRGFVTPEGRVKTKLEDYNQYRTYLHHLWSLQASQLIRHQEIEEKKRLQTLFEAVESEDPLCKMIVDGKDRLQVNEVMEELSDILPQGRMPIAEQVANPLLQSLIEWNKYQDKLLNDYKDKYPAIKEWLSDQTKNCKNFMENKINARISKDEKLRARWEKLRESSRSHFNRVNRLEEAEQDTRRRRAEKRQKAHRKMWAKQKHLASATNNTIFEVQDASSSENQLPPRFSEIKPKKISSESKWKDSGRQIEIFEESGLLSKTLDEELSEIERSKLRSKETISDHADASLPSWSPSFIEIKPEEFRRVDDITQSNAVYDIAGNVIDKLKRKLQRVGNYIELQKMAHLSSEETRNKSALTTTKMSDTSARKKFSTDGFEENPTKKSKSVKFKRKSSTKDVKLLKSSNIDQNLETDAQKRMTDELKKEVANIGRSISKLKRINQKKFRIASEKSFDQTDRKVQSENDVHNSRWKCKQNRLKSHMISKKIDKGSLKSGINKPVKKDIVEIPLNQQPLVVSSKETQFKQQLNEDSFHNVILGQQLPVETPKKISLEQQPLLESAMGAQLDQQTFVETTKNVQSEQQPPVESCNEVEFGKQFYEVSENEHKLEKQVRELVETAKEVQQIREKESEEKVKLTQQPSLKEGLEEFSYVSQMHRDSAKKAQLDRESFVETTKIVQSEQQSPVGSSNEVEFEKLYYKDSENEHKLEKQMRELVETAKEVEHLREQELEEKVELEQQPSLKEAIEEFLDVSQMHRDSAKKAQLDRESFVETTKNVQSEQQSPVGSSNEVEFEKLYYKDSENEHKLEKQVRELVETAKEVQEIREQESGEKVQLEQQPSVKEVIEEFLDVSQMHRDSAKKAHLDQQTFVETTKNFQSQQQSPVGSSNEVEVEKQSYKDSDNEYKRCPYESPKEIKFEEQSNTDDSKEILLQQHSPVRMEEEFEKQIHRDNAKDAQFNQQFFAEDAKDIKLKQQPSIESSNEEQFQKKSYRDDASEYKLPKQINKLVETAKEMQKIKEQESKENVQLGQQPSVEYDVKEFQTVPLVYRDSANESQLDQQLFDEAIKVIQLEQQPSIESSNEEQFKKTSHRDSQYNLGKHIRELVETAKEIQVIREQEKHKEVQLEKQSTIEGIKDVQTNLKMYREGTKEGLFDKQAYRDIAEETQLDQQTLIRTPKEFQLDQQSPVERADKIIFNKQLSIEIDKEVQRENQPLRYRAEEVQAKKHSLAESAKEEFEKQPYNDNARKNTLPKQISELLETAKEVKKARDFIETEKEVHLKNQYSAEILPQFKEDLKGTRLELETHVEDTENMQLEKLLLEESANGIRVEQPPSVDAAKENDVQQHMSLVNAKEVPLEKQQHKERALDAQLQQHTSVANVKGIGFDEQPEKHSVKEAQLEKQMLIETPKKIPLEKQLTIEKSEEFNFEKQPHSDSIKDYELKKGIRELVETAKAIKEINEISETDNTTQLQQQSSVESTKEIMPRVYSDGPKRGEFGKKTHKGSAKEPQLEKQLFVERAQEVYLERQPAVETLKKIQLEQHLPTKNGKKVKNQKQPDSGSIENIQLYEQPVIVRDNAKEYKLKDHIKKLVETAKEVRQTRKLVGNSKDLQLEQQSSAENVTHLYGDSHREGKLPKQSHKSYKHSDREAQFEECPSDICIKYIEHMEQPNADNVRGSKLENETLVDSAMEVKFESQLSKYSAKEKHFEKQAITVGDKDIHVEKGDKETLFKHQKLVVRANEVSLKPETLRENPKKTLFEQQPLRKIDMTVQFAQLPLSEDVKEVLLLKQPLVKNAKEICFQQLLPEENASEFQLEQLSLVDCAEEVRFVQDSLVESDKDFERIQNPLKNIDEEDQFREKSLVESVKLDHQHLEGSKQAQIENEVYCSWQKSKLEGPKLSLISNKNDKNEQHPLVESTEEVKFPNISEKKYKLKGTKSSLALDENDSKTVKEKEWLIVKNTGRILFENDVYDCSQKCKTNEAKFRVTSEETDEESSKTPENEQQPLLERTEEIQLKSDIYDSRQKYKPDGGKLRLTLKKADYDCSKIPDNQEILKDNSKKIPKRYSFLDADDLTVARKYMYEIPDCVEKGKTPQKNEISGKDLERNTIETKKIHSPDVTETIQIESVDESPLQPKTNYKNLEKSNKKKILENKNTLMLDNRDYNKNLLQNNSRFKSLIKISENTNFAKKLDTSPKRNILSEMNDLECPLKRRIKLKPDMKYSMSKTEQNLCSRFKKKPASQIGLTQGEHYTEFHSESMARIENYQDDRKLREKLSNPFYKEIFEQQKKKLDEDLIRYILFCRTSSVDSLVDKAVDCSWSRRTSYMSESQAFTYSNKSQDKEYFQNIFKENKRKLDEELAEYILNRKDKSRASTILAKNQSHVVDGTNMEGIEERVKESAFDKKESEDELEKVNKADMNKINEMSEIGENKDVLDRKEHTVEMDRQCETAFDAQKHEADSGEKVNEKAIENKEICDAKEHENGLKEKHDTKFNKKHEANVDEKENEEPFKKSAFNETSDEKKAEFNSKEEESEKKIVIELFDTNKSMQSKEAFENKIREVDFVEERETLFDKHDSEGFEVQLNENKVKNFARKVETIIRIKTCKTENETSCKEIKETSLDKTIHYSSFVQDLLPQEITLHTEITKEPKSDEDEKHLRVPRESNEKDTSKSLVQDLLPQETTLEDIFHDELTMEPKGDEDEKYPHLRVLIEHGEKDTTKSHVEDLLPQETLEGNIHNEITKEPRSDGDEKYPHLRVLIESDEKDTSKSHIEDLFNQETTLEGNIHDEITKEPRSDEDGQYPHLRVPSERVEKDTTKISVQKPVYFAQLSLPLDHKFDNTHHKTLQTIYSEPDKLEHQTGVIVSATSPRTEVNEVVKQYEIFITDENQVRHSPAISSKDAAKIDTKAKPSLVSKIPVAKRNFKSGYNDRRSVVSRTETEIMQIEPNNFQNKKEIDVFSSDKKTRSISPEATNDDALSLVPILSEPLGRPNVRTKSSSYRNRLNKSESKTSFKRPKKLQSKTPIHVTFDNVEEHMSALSPEMKLSHLNTSDASKSLGTKCSTIAKLDSLNEDMRVERCMSVSDFNQAAEELCRMFAVLSLKGRIESLVEQHHAEDDRTNDLALQQVSNAIVQEGTSIEVLERLMSALSLGITNYFESQADNFVEVVTSYVRRSYFPEDRAFTCNLRLKTDGHYRNPFNTNITVSNRIEINLKEYLRYHFPENERSPAKPTPAAMITWAPSELTENVRNFDIVEAKFEKIPQLSWFIDHLSNSNVQEREMPFLRTLDIVNNENTESETKYIDSLTGTGNNDILEPKQLLEPDILLPPTDKASAINFEYISREPSYNQDESREENQQEESNSNTYIFKEDEDVHSSPPAESPLKIEQNGDVEFKENETIESTMELDVLVTGISKIELLIRSSRVSTRIQNKLTDGLQRLESYISKPRISFKKRYSKKSKVIKRKAEKRIFIQDSIQYETVIGEEVDSEEESSSS